ncbi:DUF4177 domain-containing protein [Tritonibacter scottomollicae]|uniref:DUF4177 domain-containing protein n=1 Tax=Tritonibacter scottomollicae TaxID=483013 RepID=A0ABZ0HFL8_TRISK|nr:DUF4177 domain-containing protein [Tritonibacter scottomollicae]WOI33608.1 DUF4177 domain-containing protein [Tritonibacter scottomollicae]
MQNYEYKVVPAPNRGKKARGVKTPEARFANGIEGVLNEMAAEGWEYQRAEMLPSEERSGLTGTKTTWRNLLVFRRALAAASHTSPTLATTEPTPATAAQPVVAATTPSEAAAPEPNAELIAETERVAAPSAQPAAAPAPLTATAGDPEAPPEAIPVPGPGARRMVSDDGVEELSPVSGLTAALKARASRGKPDE